MSGNKSIESNFSWKKELKNLQRTYKDQELVRLPTNIRTMTKGGESSESLKNLSKGHFESPDDLKVDAPQEDFVMRNELRSHIEAAIHKLDPVDQKILSNRFGILGAEEKTLEQLGAELGMTKERVRQREERALRNMYRFLNFK